MKVKFFVVSVLVLLSVSCREGFISEKKNEKSIQGVKYTVKCDEGEYIDVTGKNASASSVSVSDFFLVCTQNYKGPSCSLSFDSSSGKLHVSGKSSLESCRGKDFELSYVFDIKSASENLMYLCPKSPFSVSLIIDGKECDYSSFPSFAYDIPLYGFGSSRLEIASVLEGLVFVPSGTLWSR